MEKLEEIKHILIKNQVLTACNVIFEKKAKISPVIIPNDVHDTVVEILAGIGLGHRKYPINEDFSYILIFDDVLSVESLEEIANTPLSKQSKNLFLSAIFQII